MKGIRHANHGLSEKDLRRLFPEASEAFIQAQLLGAGRPERASGPIRVSDQAGGVAAWIQNDDAAVAAGVQTPESKPAKRKRVSRVQRGEEPGARRFVVCFTVRSRRPCDWDNCWVKGLQDALVHAGTLPDDSWKHVVEGRIRTEKVQAEEDEGTLIEILEA